LRPRLKKEGQKNDKEKAEVFTKHRTDVFQTHAQEPDEDPPALLDSPTQSVVPIRLVTPKEIKDEIGLLNLKKKHLVWT
jgi:hypothetical protein